MARNGEVRFVLDISGTGRLVARSIDLDIQVEAEDVLQIKQRAQSAARAMFGRDCPVTLLVGPTFAGGRRGE